MCIGVVLFSQTPKVLCGSKKKGDTKKSTTEETDLRGEEGGLKG